MQVDVRSMDGIVKAKIVHTLSDAPFVQSCLALGLVVFRT